MPGVVVRPDLHRQFGSRSAEFRLVTDPANAYEIALQPDSELYRRASRTGLEPGESLTDLVRRSPESCDILVVCPGTFLTSPTPGVIGPHRKLSVVPCASTPVTAEQLSYFLGVCESTDHDAVAARSEAILAALESAGSVEIGDARRGTGASFDPFGDYDWNVQAGALSGGEQQIAPNGELSAVPLDIMSFDPARRLELGGQLALTGAAIVHRGGDGSDEHEQARLYSQLATIGRGDAVVLDLEHGLVVGVRPDGPEAKPAAEALEALFAADQHYRVLWEFGLGLNQRITPVDGNCGLNEMSGGRGGLLHVGLGLTPSTRFALTFQCADSTVRAGAATLATPVRGRLNRRRGPACGCDEGARGAW